MIDVATKTSHVTDDADVSIVKLRCGRTRRSSNSFIGRKPCLHPYLSTLILILASLSITARLLPKRWIVLNVSPSVPLGFYYAAHDTPQVGSLVEFRLPSEASHNSDPAGSFVLKPIFAGSGDHVNTNGDSLWINGQLVAPIHTTDSNGHPLPTWRANRALEQDEFFTFSGRVPNSFDSRYFGPIRRQEITSVRAPLFTWGKSGNAAANRSLPPPPGETSTANKLKAAKPNGRTQDKGGASASLQVLDNSRITQTSINHEDSLRSQPTHSPIVGRSLMSKMPQNSDEPDRIARTGLGGGQQSQSLHFSRRGLRHAARGPVTFERFSRPQFVIVKAYVAPHFSEQKGQDSIDRYWAYMAQKSATRNVAQVRLFNDKLTDIDAEKETKTWAQNLHHFRIIISPENGQKLNDFEAYIREVMARVERDLGSLQWLTGTHTNTDHLHAHVMIRGRARNGADLVISRHYIEAGIRQRASEVATEWLGERTRDDVEKKRIKEVQAERWTTLDGTLTRVAKTTSEGLIVNPKDIHLGPYAKTTKEVLVQRLQFLKQAGLAQRINNSNRAFFKQAPTWRLASDFQKQLNELAARNDMIRRLYFLLGNDAARVIPQVQNMAGKQQGAELTAPVRGVVIAKGAINELSDERFVVIEDHAGKPHFFRLWANETLDAARVGSVVDVGRASHRRQEIAQEIIRVAEHANDNLYATSRHRQWLAHHHPKLSAEGVERRLRSFRIAITDLLKKVNSGVVRATGNSVVVDRAKLEQFVAGRNRSLDLRLVAAFRLNEQTKANAYTWVDRQIMRAAMVKELPVNDITRNNQVKLAIALRADWLVEQGYAMRAVHDKGGHVRFLPGAKTRLVTHEHEELKRRYGENLSYLREGQAIAGVYRGTVYQHRGPFALIEANQRIYVAPVPGAPWVDKGKHVVVHTVTPQFARIELDRAQGKSRYLGIER